MLIRATQQYERINISNNNPKSRVNKLIPTIVVQVVLGLNTLPKD